MFCMNKKEWKTPEIKDLDADKTLTGSGGAMTDGSRSSTASTS